MPVEPGPTDPSSSLERFAALWRKGVDGQLRRAERAAIVATVFVFAHVARMGTPLSRLGSAAAILVSVGMATFAWLPARKAWRDAPTIVAAAIGVAGTRRCHAQLR